MVRNVSLLEKNQNLNRLEKARIWIHEHPTTVKVLKVAGLIFGVGLLASLLFVAPMLGTGITVGLAITGGLLTLASLVALFALDLLAPPHHDMKNHVYKPGSCEGGRLYYEGDVPILSLNSDDPFRAGKAHGYLCGDAINRLSKRFEFVLCTLGQNLRAKQLPKTLAAMRKVIPPEYLREMEGIIEGYNQWAHEQHWWKFPKKLTVDDALLLHLIPDETHFFPGAFEEKNFEAPSRQLAAVACSAVVDRDPQKGLVFARNMDWPSFGLAGTYSLVIHRNHTKNGLYSSVEVGIPGFVGTLTGMNSEGLSLAMNVSSSSPTQEIRGMPACLYNRACLERCRDVDTAEDFILKKLPLGAYHLTLVDRKRAESAHFYQGGENVHFRRLDRSPLVTLNDCYDPHPIGNMHYSDERQRMLNEFFQNRKNKSLEESLSLPFVNNWLTTHRVVMEPVTGTFKVAFNNAFAGRSPLREVPIQKLFQKS